MGKMAPVHPGEIISEEFLKPMGISKYRLSKDTNMNPTRVGEIVSGKRRISADTALRLSKYFGVSAEFWMNLQSKYDLEIEKDKLGDKINN